MVKCIFIEVIIDKFPVNFLFLINQIPHFAQTLSQNMNISENISGSSKISINVILSSIFMELWNLSHCKS